MYRSNKQVYHFTKLILLNNYFNKFDRFIIYIRTSIIAELGYWDQSNFKMLVLSVFWRNYMSVDAIRNRLYGLSFVV
jgi:hypothetical protein